MTIGGGYPTADNESRPSTTTEVVPMVIDDLGQFDRQHAVENVEGLALPLMARTATSYSADLPNFNARGVLVTVNVTAVGATGGLALRIWGKDPLGGASGRLNAAPANITAIGTYQYVLYPGASGGAVAQATPLPLPRTWYLEVTHADATSYTYSVGYSTLH